MKLWKLILGFFGLVGGLFAANAVKSKEVKELEGVIKENKKKVDIKNFENRLYTKNIPDPDLLIRTGGTKRLSNFLLWQLAYTEIFFIDKLWPDFNENDFNKVVTNFSKIKRKIKKKLQI